MGISRAQIGQAENKRKGKATPKPMAEKRHRPCIGLKSTANPSKDPRIGPVHGVAMAVVNKPLAYEESIEDEIGCEEAAKDEIFIPISKRPNRFIATTNKQRMALATNKGSCS